MNKYLSLLLLISHNSFAEEKVDCEKASTTIEMNVCAMQKADQAHEMLEKYLAKAREKYSDEKPIVGALNVSQESWLKYRKAHCDAVYKQWSGGTIRGVMFAGCMLKLTKLRTHVIWGDYLTYMDSTPPMLPEPKLY